MLGQQNRLHLSRSEIYGATTGGLRIDDPGADLAIGAALASAASGRPPPRGTGFVGEISLTGSVRPVSGLEARLTAARAAGIRSVVLSRGSGGVPAPPGVHLVPVGHVREAIGWALEGGQTRKEASSA